MGDSYIRLVHHLIEECILFDMGREECMEALSKHANIMPAITSTVWKELEKENKEFFEAYERRRSDDTAGDIQNRIQRLVSESTSKDTNGN